MNRIVLLLLILFPVFCYSQVDSDPAKTYLSIEGGGSGIIASANIAQTLFIHKRVKAIAQIGIGWAPKEAKSDLPFDVPIQITANFGKNEFYVEAGMGSTLLFKSKLESDSDKDLSTLLYVSPVLGFRYEKNKYFCRLYGCPLVNVTGEHLKDDVTKGFIKFGIAIGTRF